MRSFIGYSVIGALSTYNGVLHRTKSARCDAAELDSTKARNVGTQAGTAFSGTPHSYTSYTPTSTWNDNWDHCQHPSDDSTSKEGGAIRQIILVRHGQYNHGHGGDHIHTLTELGHDQAKETGKRLALLFESKKIYPLQRVYFSTMIRATETWQDIQSVLPPTILPPVYDIRPCTMIREGAVCKPVPSSSNWNVSEIDFIRDQPRVSIIIFLLDMIFSFKFSRSKQHS